MTLYFRMNLDIIYNRLIAKGKVEYSSFIFFLNLLHCDIFKMAFDFHHLSFFHVPAIYNRAFTVFC